MVTTVGAKFNYNRLHMTRFYGIENLMTMKEAQEEQKKVQQESCAIAKMTAQCALHMGALKIFGTP